MSVEDLNENERVPLKERNIVQYFIFQKALGEKPEGMDANEWALIQSRWYEDHGKAMSDLIDRNSEVRKLITAGQFESAADLVLKLLDQSSTRLAA